MSISIRMHSTSNWRPPEKARELFGLLAQFDLTPDKYGRWGQTPYPFSAESHGAAIGYWYRKPEPLGFYSVRRKALKSSVSVNWQYQEDKQFNQLNVWLDNSQYAKLRDAPWLISLGTKLYDWGNIHYGQIWDEPIPLGRIGPNLRTGLFPIKWANYFGPLYVEFLGRKRFLTAPAFAKTELSDGGFLLLTSARSEDLGKPEVQQMELEIMNHLGRDAFMDKDYQRKMCSIPLFDFQAQPSQGHPSIQEASDLVSIIIPNAEDFIHQASLLSERLKHRLGNRLDYSPSSLKIVDDYILRKSRGNADIHETTPGQQLLQELTAYYGEVLRRNLNGKWIVVGDKHSEAHPAIRFEAAGVTQIELALVRIEKLWFERVRDDGLAIRFYLLSSGQWQKAIEFLTNR